MPITDLRSRMAELAWFVRGMLGGNAYEHYRAHHYATDCPEPLLNEREFWRRHMDESAAAAQTRCC